jgi:nitroreductase
LDLELFVQTVMIAARARGIDTCPQVSFARFHPVIASNLHLPTHHGTACGMSMGRAEITAPVNRVLMPPHRAREFAQLVGFDRPTPASPPSAQQQAVNP